MARLPQIDFKPVIQPYVKPPVEAFGNLVQGLRDDYDEGLEYDSKSQQAIAAARVVNPYDQPVLDKYNQELISQLEAAREKGDYENSVSSLKKGLSNYVGKITPIMERNQMFDQLKQDAIKANADPTRVMNAVFEQERRNPTLKDEDGYVFNQLKPQDFNKYIAPQIDLPTEYGKVAQMVQDEIIQSSKFQKLTEKQLTDLGIENRSAYVPVKTSYGTRYVKKSEIEPLIDARMQSTDIQRYLNAEGELTKSEFFTQLKQEGLSDEDAELISSAEAEARKENLSNNAKGAVSDAYAFKNITSDQDVQNSLLPKDGAGSKPSNGLILTSTAAGNQISHPDQFKDIPNQINKLREQGDESGASTLEAIQKYYSDQMLNELNPDQREVYNLFSGENQEELKRLLDVFATGQLGVTNPEQIKEYEVLKQKLKSKGLLDKVDFQGTHENSVLGILNKGDKKLEENLKNVPPITRQNITYYGSNKNKDTFTNVGLYNDELNEAKGSANLSLVENFTTRNGKSWNEYFNKEIEDKYSDEYANVDWELVGQDGFDLSGLPMTTVAVYGENDNGGKKTIELHNVTTGGDQSWSNANRLGNALINDGISQLQRGEETGRQVYQKGVILKEGVKKLPSGRRVSQEVMRINPDIMISETPYYINVGGSQGRISVIKNKDNTVNIKENGQVVTANGRPMNFYNQFEIMNYVGTRYGIQQ